MQTVFITGGARRIGRSLALSYAAKGYNVGFTYNTSIDQSEKTLSELKAFGVGAEKYKCNVKDEGELHLALQTAAQRLGIPDVIVSNAGIFPPKHTLDELTPAILLETMSVNSLPLLTIAKSYKKLRASAQHTPGRIVSISSLGAFEIWKDRIDYNVSKSSLLTLVKALARMLAPDIVVNSVAPGAIKVENEPTEAEKSLVAEQKIPVGRYGTADDLFDAVWFFSTCTPYITGQVITVDGGLSLTH